MTDQINRKLEAALFILISLIGIALKIYFTLDASDGDFQKLRFSDELAYYLPAANEIISHGGSFFLNERSLWNGPLNPLWIAALRADVLVIKIANIILVMLAGVMVWRLLRRRSQATALFALLIWNIYPPLIDFTPTLLTEPPCIFLFTLGLFLFESRRPLFAGLSFGLASLVRPTTQLLPLFLFAVGYFSKDRQVRKELIQVALGLLIVITPYILKNYFLWGRPTIANGFGAVLQLGTNLRTYGDEPIYYGLDFDTQRYTKEYTHLDSEGDKRLVAAAVGYSKKHPLAITELMFIKPFRLFLGSTRHYFFPYNGFESFWEFEKNSWRIFMVLGELLITPFIVILGFFGMISANPNQSNRLKITLILYFAAIHALAFPIPRMALPLFPIFLTAAFDAKKLAKWLAISITTFVVAFLAFSSRNHLLHEYAPSYPDYFEHHQSVNLSAPLQVQGMSYVENTLTVTGPDPFLAFSSSIDTDRNQLVLLEIEVLTPPKRNKKPIWGQFFWTRDDKFDENSSAPFLFRATPGVARYALSVTGNPNWNKGSIKAVRLDFGERVRGLAVKLKQLEIVR